MNKTQKRQLHIRNKLIAAVAMLLVSSIMMVSTTYAWFTLSTAPEVQGITTTVGANGNLEIALSPADGKSDSITSAMGDSTKSWTEKNLTWGNLLNLSDSSYRLSDIVLLPARLNSDLSQTPLKTPVYGADGRIKTLDANTTFGTYDATQQDFVQNTSYGVRAVGTSSSMTEYQSSFYNNLSRMSIAMNNAQDKAEASLNNNGAALAEMAINHANAGDTDTSDYSAYLDDLEAVLTDLYEANGYLEQGIRSALLATASSSKSTLAAYTWAQSNVVDTKTLPTIWADLSSNGITLDSTNPLQQAYDTWYSVNVDLVAAGKALQSAQTKDTNNETVGWSDVSTIMGKIMNTSGITINNKSLSDFKTLVANGTATAKPDGLSDDDWAASKKFVSDLMSGVNLQLNNNSGVYADLAKAVGNLNAGVELDSLTYGTTTIYYVKCNIVTTTGSDPYLQQVNVGLQTGGALTVEGATASAVIDVTYGYMVDFMFRTNASGSNLMLQTAAAQRVYSDSDSEATLGGGSTMTFASGSVDVQTIKGLMECVRVVFFDTESAQIYGVAKLDMSAAGLEELTAATDTAAATYNVTAPLYLYKHTFNDSGVLTFGDTEIKLSDTNGSTADTADDAKICEMPTNTVKRVSVLVYLDGDNVGNEDVVNATSTASGTLNLQFASSANLVPMENTALETMQLKTYKVNATVDGESLITDGSINEGESFSYTVSDPNAIDTVTVSVGGTVVNDAYNSTTGKLTINNIAGDVVITITTKSSSSSSTTTTYTVTVDGTEQTTGATAGSDYSYTISDYDATNTSVTVSIGGTTAAAGTAYTISDQGVLTIGSTYVTGNIVITTSTTSGDSGTNG